VIRRAALATAFVLAAGACGPAVFIPPAGPGAPVDATPAWAEATNTCRSARSYAATLRVGGRAVGHRIWGRLSIETAVTSSNIYMGATFSGQPIFVLAGTPSQATLWLRRENRAVRAAASDIIEAILGVAIPPDRLLSILSGCGTRAFEITSAGSHAGLVSVQTSDTRVFLKRGAEGWRTFASEADGFTVKYSWKTTNSPDKLWIRSIPGREPSASLDVSASDVSLNEALPPSVFSAPAGAASAEAMTLEELRGGTWRKQP